jgi:hypothetical protein
MQILDGRIIKYHNNIVSSRLCDINLKRQPLNYCSWFTLLKLLKLLYNLLLIQILNVIPTSKNNWLYHLTKFYLYFQIAADFGRRVAQSWGNTRFDGRNYKVLWSVAYDRRLHRCTQRNPGVRPRISLLKARRSKILEWRNDRW